MDLRSFFEKGHSVTKIEKDVADTILVETCKLEFSYPDKILTDMEHPVYHASTGLFYCDCTTSGTATKPPKAARKLENPSVNFFSSFWNNVSDSHLMWFNKNFGKFSRLSKQFHNFQVDDYLKFHFDYKDAVPVIAILYIGSDDFDYSDGGYLEIGRCSVDSDFEIESVQPIQKILPNHGTLIFINNLTPFFAHAVSALQVSKPRYTAVCQFGYSENEIYSLQERGWSIL